MSLLATLPTFAQVSSGTQSLSLPSATYATRLQDAVYLYQPALLTQVQETQLFARIAPSRFGLSDLSAGGVSGIFPLISSGNNKIIVGGDAQFLGGDLYNELSTSLAFGGAVTQNFSAGISMEVTQLRIQDTPTQTMLMFHGGASLQMSNEVVVGFLLRNLGRSHYGEEELTIDGKGTSMTVSQSGTVSVGISTVSNLHADIGVTIDINHGTSLVVLGAYDFMQIFRFHVGLQTTPQSVQAGFSINVSDMLVSSLVHYDAILGISTEWNMAIEI
jgi:hypothetical protein